MSFPLYSTIGRKSFKLFSISKEFILSDISKYSSIDSSTAFFLSFLDITAFE